MAGCSSKNQVIYSFDAKNFADIYQLSKDNNDLYLDHIIGGEFTERNLVEGVDLDSFEVFQTEEKFHLLADKNAIYTIVIGYRASGPKVRTYKYSKYPDLEELGLFSFETLNYRYAKDSNNVYLLNMNTTNSFVTKMEGVPSWQFEIIEGSYAKDRENVYFDGAKLENVDTASFEVMRSGYTKDKHSVYLHNKILEYSDPISFELLANYGCSDLAKDTNNVYLNGELKEEVDVASFELIDDTILARDKNSIYRVHGGKECHALFDRVSHIEDIAAFQSLGGNYYTYQDQLYHMGTYYRCPEMENCQIDSKDLTEVDLGSFEVVILDNQAYSEKPYDAKDKNNFYRHGKIVEVEDN